MPAQGLEIKPSSLQHASPDITHRPLATFHPNIWGQYFLSCPSVSGKTEAEMQQEVGKLKEEVKRMMIACADEPSQILNLIDLIQRLGVAYHFEQEIEEALQRVMDACRDSDSDDDLHSVSLRFRLLREHGFNISCNVFNKFKDENGHLNDKLLKNNIKGILSLYEAAHLRIHGEGILEEALDFTTTHLQSMGPAQLGPLHAEQVSRTLRQPLRKSLARLEARHFISIYQQDTSHNQLLLRFAKLDFNLLQKLHQKELRYISMWWKDLNVTARLPFVRDRLVEGYFWILGVYFEPQYSVARKFLTKVMSMTSIIDDAFDAYGTLPELVLFTDAVNRWDIDCIHGLPEYMKLCYKALLDVYEETEKELSKQGRAFCLQYSKEAMKQIVEAYLVEARWMHQKYVPSMEEYMSIALITCGYTLLPITSFVGMGDSATMDVFHWASHFPKILAAASLICRLMDDIVSHEFEQRRGHVASSVECYMKQNGATEEEAVAEFKKQILDAWKDINEECLHKPANVPRPFLTRVVNFARVIDYLYKDGDEYTHVGELMKSSIAAVLIHPLQI